VSTDDSEITYTSYGEVRVVCNPKRVSIRVRKQAAAQSWGSPMHLPICLGVSASTDLLQKSTLWNQPLVGKM
jgi:hypothetical protein